MTEPETFDANLRAALEPAYTLERELVGGGMSRVFLATERALNRQVVIKVLPPELAAGVNRERFRREVQLAAQLQHPHIVPLYSAGEHGDLLFYTMPFIDGESLKHAIHERQGKSRFTPREVVHVLHDVVDALAYAHARGVVHRDIKPGNVLRSGRHAVVTDFGVAKAISASLPSVGATTSGMAIGTPAYMAPEQLAGDPAADHRMDIYAVGLLGYELLAGEAPFSENSPQATLAAQLTRDPEPLSTSREDVPPALSALIMKCLAKNPSGRPQTAGELLVELDALAFTSGDYVPQRTSPSRRMLAAAAAVVLIAAAAGALVIRGRDSAAASRSQLAAQAAPAPPPALTHADSLAIAKAVERRIAERTAAVAPASSSADNRALMAKMADSLRVEMMKAVFDSLAKTRPSAPAATSSGFEAPASRMVDSMVRSLRGGIGMNFGGDRGSNFNGRGPSQPSHEMMEERLANMGPPRRVLVTLPMGLPDRRDVAAASAAIADSLRRMLGASHRFVVVSPRDSVHSELLATRHTADSVLKAVNADMAVSVFASARRDSSVSWTIMLHDGTAGDGTGLRTVSAHVRKDSLLAPIDSLVIRSARYLDAMDRVPRRGAVDPFQRAFDERAANMGAPRRIVVWDHPPDGSPALREAGSAVMDVVRKTLAGNARFAPLSRDSTLAALEKSRDRNMVMPALHADMMVSIRGRMVRGDSVAWTLTAWDLGATAGPGNRSVSAPPVPIGMPLMHADTLVARTIQALLELDHAPRRAVVRDDRTPLAPPAAPAAPTVPVRKP